MKSLDHTVRVFRNSASLVIQSRKGFQISIIRGANWFGECDVPSPNQNFVAIAAAGRFDDEADYAHFCSLGLKDDGSVVCWGSDLYGQCSVPEPNEDFVTVSGGEWHCMGLKSINTSIEPQPDPELFLINAVNPNPISSTASILYSSPGLLHVNLEIFDMTGRMVKTIVIGSIVAGQHTVT